jgi:dihydrofolate reductase
MAHPLTLVAAMDENNAIGRDGALPWRIPEDLARFKALTLGHCLLMGRKTYDSIGRPLPGRTTIVVTRQPDWAALPGVHVVHTVDEGIELGAAVQPGEPLMVIGGGEIYRQTVDLASRLEITHVHTKVDGADAFFPAIDPTAWQVVASADHGAFTFTTYARASLTP